MAATAGSRAGRSRRRRRPVLELAAGQRDALGQADEARAGRRAAERERRAAATPTARRLTTSTTRAAPVSAAIVTSTAAAGACLRALVSPSCTIAVGRAPERGREHRVAGHVDVRSGRACPATRDSSISAGISASVGCGGSGPARRGPSRSTPMTSRSSSSAACALERMTAAACGDLLGRRRRDGTPARRRAGSAARRGGPGRRASRARCAAARPRGPARRAARCSASTRSARSRSESTSSRWTRTNRPQPTTTPVMSTPSAICVRSQLVARVEQREDRGRGQRQRRAIARIARRERADGDVEERHQRRPAGHARHERQRPRR